MSGRIELPVAVRARLGELVTETRGVARVLSDDGPDDKDTRAAIGMWLERIAHDLEDMECSRYPYPAPGEAAR